MLPETSRSGAGPGQGSVRGSSGGLGNVGRSEPGWRVEACHVCGQRAWEGMGGPAPPEPSQEEGRGGAGAAPAGQTVSAEGLTPPRGGGFSLSPVSRPPLALAEEPVQFREHLLSTPWVQKFGVKPRRKHGSAARRWGLVEACRGRGTERLWRALPGHLCVKARKARCSRWARPAASPSPSQGFRAGLEATDPTVPRGPAPVAVTG